MRKLGLLAEFVLVLTFSGGSAAAQARRDIIQEGVWNSSLSSALSVARYTGRPVLVFFTEDWCGYCEQLEQVLVHKDLEKALRRFILVKTTIEDDPAAAKAFKVDMHHQVVMLDWSGRVIGKIVGATHASPAQSVRDVATAVIEGAAVSDLYAGDKLVELGYYSKAAERYRLASEISRDEKTIERAGKGLADIRERSQRQMELIKQLIRAGRLEEAIDASTEFIKDFPPDMGRREAEKLLARLKTGKPIPLGEENPAGPKTKPGVKPADEAKRLVEEGMVYEWDKRFYDAALNYEKAVKLYRDTPAAAEAAARLKLLFDDPKTHALIELEKQRTECLRWLEMGKLYEKNGRDEEASKYYTKVLTTYPESDFAAEARRRLTEIERRHLREPG